MDTVHQYLVAGVDNIESDGTTHLKPGLSVRRSYAIDSKTDDGKPNSGAVRAEAGNGTTSLDISGSAGTASSDCVTAADETGLYNVTSAALDSPNCHLLIRAQGL